MKNQIVLENILDKYVIVVEGDEKSIVYQVDDSSIFSVEITGCGRGARNAALSHNSFFETLKEAEKAIKYLESSWLFKFKVVKVSDLKDISPEGWDILMGDIEFFNFLVHFDKEMEESFDKSEKKYAERFLKKFLQIDPTECTPKNVHWVRAVAALSAYSDTVDVIQVEVYRDGGTVVYQDRHNRRYYQWYPTKKVYNQHPHITFDNDTPAENVKEIFINLNIVEEF